MKLKKIHSDSRGEIYILTDFIGLEEITIFFTNKGYARGGCIHNLNNENCCLIKGRINYTIGNKLIEGKAGDVFYIPKNTPHYFVALEDCIVMEWGATAIEKKKKHKEFRKIVDKINLNEERKKRNYEKSSVTNCGIVIYN